MLSEFVKSICNLHAEASKPLAVSDPLNNRTTYYQRSGEEIATVYDDPPEICVIHESLNSFCRHVVDILAEGCDAVVHVPNRGVIKCLTHVYDKGLIWLNPKETKSGQFVMRMEPTEYTVRDLHKVLHVDLQDTGAHAWMQYLERVSFVKREDVASFVNKTRDSLGKTVDTIAGVDPGFPEHIMISISLFHESTGMHLQKQVRLCVMPLPDKAKFLVWVPDEDKGEVMHDTATHIAGLIFNEVTSRTIDCPSAKEILDGCGRFSLFRAEAK